MLAVTFLRAIAQTAIGETIAGCAVAVFAGLLARKPLKRHRAAQQRLVDLVDTEKPGGLADVVKALDGRFSETGASDRRGHDQPEPADQRPPAPH